MRRTKSQKETLLTGEWWFISFVNNGRSSHMIGSTWKGQSPIRWFFSWLQTLRTTMYHYVVYLFHRYLTCKYNKNSTQMSQSFLNQRAYKLSWCKFEARSAKGNSSKLHWKTKKTQYIFVKFIYEWQKMELLMKRLILTLDSSIIFCQWNRRWWVKYMPQLPPSVSAAKFHHSKLIFLQV